MKRLLEQTTNLKHNNASPLLWHGSACKRTRSVKGAAYRWRGNMQVPIAVLRARRIDMPALPTSILEQLRTYFKTYRPKEYLFEGQYGGAYTTRSAQAVFKQAMHRGRYQQEHRHKGSAHRHSLRHPTF
ncbi:MAG: hypothetical protein IPI00_12500 [Flavobacteriales bacterium]|nr:hypothetical protein [Flavobacteriales bacterium]